MALGGITYINMGSVLELFILMDLENSLVLVTKTEKKNRKGKRGKKNKKNEKKKKRKKEKGKEGKKKEIKNK